MSSEGFGVVTPRQLAPSVGRTRAGFAVSAAPIIIDNCNQIASGFHHQQGRHLIPNLLTSALILPIGVSSTPTPALGGLTSSPPHAQLTGSTMAAAFRACAPAIPSGDGKSCVAAFDAELHPIQPHRSANRIANTDFKPRMPASRLRSGLTSVRPARVAARINKIETEYSSGAARAKIPRCRMHNAISSAAAAESLPLHSSGPRKPTSRRVPILFTYVGCQRSSKHMQRIDSISIMDRSCLTYSFNHYIHYFLLTALSLKHVCACTRGTKFQRSITRRAAGLRKSCTCPARRHCDTVSIGETANRL